MQLNISIERETELTRILKRQNIRVPLAYRFKEGVRNKSFNSRELRLDSAISTAMVTVQVRIDQAGQRTRFQLFVEQREQKAGMGDIARINQYRSFTVIQQNTV
jgi:hypothetical protein